MSDSSHSQIQPEIVEEGSTKVIRYRAVLRQFTDPFLSSALPYANGLTTSTLLTITYPLSPEFKKALELECNLLKQNGCKVRITYYTTGRVTLEIAYREIGADEQDSSV